MTRSRPTTFLASAAVIPLAAVALAACGGGGSAATAAPAPTPTKAKTTPAKTATVRVGHSKLGSILVTSQGRTVYLFKADSAIKSACSGTCATAWPPLLAHGKPTAGAGLSAAKLGTITRSGGQRQVTYNGHPLYLFIEDHKPGDTTGQGVVAFGAAWFAVSPAGNQIAKHKSSAARAAKSAPKPATTPAPPPAPKPATTPAPPPAPKPATTPAPPPAPKPASHASNGIPQNGGGDDDSDNHGGPSDGDGDI